MNSDNPIYWNVIYTVPKSEKSVQRTLEELEIDSFLPLYKKVRQWRNKNLCSIVPLFPGYVFAKVPRTMKWQILNIKGVVKFVSIQNEPCKVSDKEISHVKQIVGIDEGTAIQRESYFVRGQKVSILHGPFGGLQGEIIEERGNHRFLIRIHAIREAFSITMDLKMLASMDEAVLA
jgi:transcription antitermination factor NusG